VAIAALLECVLFTAEAVFKALCVGVVLPEDAALDPGGVGRVEEDWEACLVDAAALPLARLFLIGEETELLLEDVEDDS
jgi:hypothetical protein